MDKLTDWFRRGWLVLLIAGIWIALDQLTKDMIRQQMPLHSTLRPIEALGDYFSFEHVNNYGAAFGILQNRGYFFIIVAVVVISALLYYVRYLPENQWLIRLLLGLQLGGAAGNLIDRIERGYVTDFVKLGIPNFYYIPNFNIADSGIVLGVIGLGIYIIVTDIRAQQRLNQTPAGTAGQ